ncbi:MAG: haloacid dehalogenase-like hydrolase [Opitutales bacterium]|jgi:phosphoglycolate phosphatase
MSASKLILWDLDETLVSTDGAGERAFEKAAKKVFGEELSLREIDYSGQTDKIIAILVRRHVGFSEHDDASLDRFLTGFLNFLPNELPLGNPRVLPGVERVTSMIMQEATFAQGLLTGNLAAGAETKLRYFGLWERFPFGAFADDANDREQLGPIALKRAAIHHGTEFLADSTIVIGDTVRDISCARAFNALSLAVASGQASVDELLAAGADCVVESIEDEMVLDFIGFPA